MVAPVEHCATQMIPTIRQHPKEPKRIFSLLRWGLIPYWAKDPSIGLKTINAVSEAAAVNQCSAMPSNTGVV
jgi:putative SOS response-associated peptidase YedK